MATLKMKKYPKKPKQGASVETKQNYIARCREIDRENSKRKSINAKSAALSKKIASMKH